MPQGRYRFERLAARQLHDRRGHARRLVRRRRSLGTVDGRTVGRLAGNDTMADIVLTSGQAAIDYDFCEQEPASLSGYVYHDRNNNGRRETGEEPLAGVRLHAARRGRPDRRPDADQRLGLLRIPGAADRHVRRRPNAAGRLSGRDWTRPGRSAARSRHGGEPGRRDPRRFRCCGATRASTTTSANCGRAASRAMSTPN